jgi:TatD DNase family protein
MAGVSAPALSVQRAVFLDQITLARETGRPLTIHCLRAWGELADCFRQQTPPSGFLMHSFSGSLETARHLAKTGAWFSFSGSFLHERKRSVREVFYQLPRELVLLETDAPDMPPPSSHITHPLPGHLNHPANLPAIGTALAHLWHIDPAELASVTHQNTRAWLGDG